MAIQVRGAREHNLKAVDLDLPLGKFVVFTGPSGSGKTSLALDTFHVEGQRRYLEALGMQALGRRKLRPPKFDVLVGLPPTIALEQGESAPNPRSTVGSRSEVMPLLRVLFARAGVQHCPTCDREIRVWSHDRIVSTLLQSPEGTRVSLEATVRTLDLGATLKDIEQAGFSRVRLGSQVLRLEEVRGETGPLRVVVDRIRLESSRSDRLFDAVRTTVRAGGGRVVAVFDEGEREFSDRPYCGTCDLELLPLEPSLLSFNARGGCAGCGGTGRVDEKVCEECDGSRLIPQARSVVLHGTRFDAIGGQTFTQFQAWLATIPDNEISSVPLAQLRTRVSMLLELGLGSLPLGRPLSEVSAGERQRLRLVRQVGASLSGVLVILDEPAAGLSDREVGGVLSVIRQLIAQGNTVLAVEHHPALVLAADHVVDFGPGAGQSGGQVMFEGPPEALAASDTLTGKWLSGRESWPVAFPWRGEWADWSEGGVSIRLPKNGLGALVAPSGGGKSRVLAAIDSAVRDGRWGAFQRVRGLSGSEGTKNARSMVATFVGLWDRLRELLAATPEAKLRGFEAGMFSLNQRGGRCEICLGAGVERVDLGALPSISVVCSSCEGRRFHADVLTVLWKGRNPLELLEMSAKEGLQLLAGHPALEQGLRALVDVGLGYVTLGQSSSTLSGGEMQRLRLARELAGVGKTGIEGTLYLLDDPTVGLHPSDAMVLLGLFQRLIREGATVWVATHDRKFANAADHVHALSVPVTAVDEPVDNPSRVT